MSVNTTVAEVRLSGFPNVLRDFVNANCLDAGRREDVNGLTQEVLKILDEFDKPEADGAIEGNDKVDIALLG